MFKDLLQRLAGSKPAVSLPNPESLLLAMQTVGQRDTDGNRAKLYGEFLRSWLWFCVPEFPEGWKPGMTVLPAGMKISVATPDNAKGEKVLPVFTEPTALANYDPNSPHLAFPAIEIFKMAVKLGVAEIIVNPFDPVRKPTRAGGTLTRREFEALAEGMIPQRTPDGKGQVLTVQEPVQVQIGRCQDPARDDIRSQLDGTAARFPEVEKIFRYRMRYVDTGVESEVFGLVCRASGNRLHEITGNLMSDMQPLIAPGHYVDFTSLRPSDMPLMQTHGELVYERRTVDAAQNG
jgi:hypothetical protein